MSSQISQILSNFKLFSQNNEPISTTQDVVETTLKYKLTLGFLVGVVIVLVYFKREELSKVAAGWINIAGLSDALGELWLNTHLNSAGELATTYVPTDFSLFSSANDIAESLPLPELE